MEEDTYQRHTAGGDKSGGRTSILAFILVVSAAAISRIYLINIHVFNLHI
jgi:hypothetical protein